MGVGRRQGQSGKALDSLASQWQGGSEVKLIQVPGALPARRAPHTAVIALQLSLPLPLLPRLLSSLHLVGGRRLSQGRPCMPEI